MRLKIFVSTLLYVFVLHQYITAQHQVVPISPEASSLAKVVNYPVNYNTGIPNIDIPLYQISTGGMTLPISISYHAGGFKINERSTSVGLGWSLTCDIQITRSVNGLDDFQPAVGYIANTKMKAYYENSSTGEYPLYTIDPFWGRNSFDIASGNVDGMPDKFYYKLLNKSGAFYFQKNSAGTSYTIVPVPYDNIRIQYNNGQFIITDTDGTTYTFGSQGPVSTETIAEMGLEFSESGISGTRSAWKCKKIDNATNTESIVFTYQAKPVISHVNKTESIEFYSNESPCNLNQYRTSNDINGSITSYESLIAQIPFFHLSSPKYIQHFADGASQLNLPYANNQTSISNRTFTFNQSPNTSSSSIYGLAISKIEFNGGAVHFSGTDRLNAIEVRDAANQEIKTFSFFHSYATAMDMPAAQIANGFNFLGTLYLDSIQLSGNGNVFERYMFLYKQKYCFGNHLKGKDAWGYPNVNTRERSSSQSWESVPEQEIIQRFYKDINGGCVNFVNDVIFKFGEPYNYENPEKTASQYGIIKRIIYPTGGYVDFDFEGNMYDEAPHPNVHAVRMCGGLRIRAINYFDGIEVMPVRQKYYRYGELEDGLGLVINSPGKTYKIGKHEYEAYSYTQNMNYLTGPGSGNLGSNFDPIPVGCANRGCLHLRFKEKKTTYMPASSSDYTFPNGAPVYYTKVTEYNQDMGKNSGKTAYSYYKPNDFGHYTFSFTYKSKLPGTNVDVLQTDGLMGAQKSIEEYSYENGKFSLTHSKVYEYMKYSKAEQIRVVASYMNNLYSLEGGNFSGSQMDLYNTNYSFASSAFWEGGDFLTAQYGIQAAKLLPVKEDETWISNSGTLVQHTEYFYDDLPYLQPSRIITSNSKQQQVQKAIKYAYHLSGTVYNQMVALNMISLPVEEIVSNLTLSQHISHTKTNFGEINAGFGFIAPISMQLSNGGGILETMVTFDLYDQNANLLQTTGKNGITTSYLWGYGYKYPVAEFVGSSYANATASINVFSLQGITNEAQLRSILNNLRAALPSAMVSTFIHKPLVGIVSKTTPGGQDIFYTYDAYGRLLLIKDQQQKILKQFDYLLTGPTTANALTPYYVNVPVMRTFSTLCTDLSRQPFNAFINGGTYGYNSQEIADNSAENNMELDGPSQGSNLSCEGPAETIPITLNLNMEMFLLPTPEAVYLDFIQDGSVVYSQKFPYNNTLTTQLYIKSGTYKVSMRLPSNYNGSTLRYSIWQNPPSGPGSMIMPGNSLLFEAGSNYQITLSNQLIL